MQEPSGLTGLIPLMCTSVIWGQYPGLLTLNLSGCTIRVAAVSDDSRGGHEVSIPTSGSPSGGAAVRGGEVVGKGGCSG